MKEKYDPNKEYGSIGEIGSYDNLTPEERRARIENTISLYKAAPIDPELKDRIIKELEKQLAEETTHHI